MSRRRLTGAIVALVLLLVATSTAPAVGAAERTKITVGGSDFGGMIWAPGRQAIYISRTTSATSRGATGDVRRRGRLC